MSIMNIEPGISSDNAFQPIEFEKDHGLLVLYNPQNPTAIEHAKAILKNGQDSWPGGGPVVVRPTEKTIKDNAELLNAEQLEGPRHLTLLGGDGTCRMGLLAVRHSDFKGVSTVSAEGYANDLANSIHSDPYKRDPINAFIDGRVSNIWPLDISMTSEDGKAIGIESAISYTGIGISGVVAQYFDSAEYRGSIKPNNKALKYAKEFLITKELFKRARSFTINDQELEPRQVISYVVLNGGRMAKTRFMPYSKIFNRDATVSEIATTSKIDLIKSVGQLIAGKGKTFGIGEDLNLKVSYESNEPLLLQSDGELREISSGTTLTFRLGNDPIQVAQTRI